MTDPETLARAGNDSTTGFPAWPLHQLVCASTLIVERDRDGRLNFNVETYSRSMMGERAIVASVERTIEKAFEVQTFNGAGFDIPVLLNRSAITGEPAPTIAKLHAQPRFRQGVHVDFLQEMAGYGAAPRFRLADACANFGIPVKIDTSGEQVADLVERGEWTQIENYCETDVVATWLTGLYWRSAERSSPDLIVEGWNALAAWIKSDAMRLAHLSPYASLPPIHRGGSTLGEVDLAELGI
ncbi:hypothetical protein GRI58_10735 [Porphyrobacter algicida]|uniref:Predicted 3'-5' exonuclease PolB-like domain-containing protein n=1 Tax=Qipengyuania algicida TaxID=1836209 RepID=A0A845AL84_9SPHN|nr:ribonuclease H-like domain-containing protein [Qipengyuania algicida]MXP29296.1 hypothetical protein [Qipengyuania algicida]